jgi:hypothetical protein
MLRPARLDAPGTLHHISLPGRCLFSRTGRDIFCGWSNHVDCSKILMFGSVCKIEPAEENKSVPFFSLFLFSKEMRIFEFTIEQFAHIR